jgi:prenyltransferase beta subunit
MLSEEATRAAMQSAQDYVNGNPQQWRPAPGVRYETLNHLVRVWIQEETIGEHDTVISQMCADQNPDGGWDDTYGGAESRTRTSCFCTQMLLRATRQLDFAPARTAMGGGLRFILARQEADGCWHDARWPTLDATSVAVGTLVFALEQPEATGEQQSALERGMAYVLDARADDGLWYHKPTASPVEITAHLLQKVALYDGSHDAVPTAMDGLLGLQDATGHWDAENVDGTCDAVRCLMLAAQTPAGGHLRDQVGEAAERAMSWLLSAQNDDGGFGARPARASSVLFTCDVLDTALKYEIFLESQPLAGSYR